MSACRRQYPGRSREPKSLLLFPPRRPSPGYGRVGFNPALPVSGPAQRLLALQPADSPSRLMRPSTPEASAVLLPPPPLRLLPGGAIQFPGGSSFPLWTSTFSRRTVTEWLQVLTPVFVNQKFKPSVRNSFSKLVSHGSFQLSKARLIWKRDTNC
jgi:hypothetical protein